METDLEILDEKIARLKSVIDQRARETLGLTPYPQELLQASQALNDLIGQRHALCSKLGDFEDEDEDVLHLRQKHALEICKRDLVFTKSKIADGYIGHGESDDDLYDATRYAVEALETLRIDGITGHWRAELPRGYRNVKPSFHVMTAQGRVNVQACPGLGMDPMRIIYEIEHQGRDWYSVPIVVKHGQPLTAIHEISNLAMERSMRTVTAALCHPETINILMRSIAHGRADGTESSGQARRTAHEMRESMLRERKPELTIFLRELDNIK